MKMVFMLLFFQIFWLAIYSLDYVSVTSHHSIHPPSGFVILFPVLFFPALVFSALLSALLYGHLTCANPREMDFYINNLAL